MPEGQSRQLDASAIAALCDHGENVWSFFEAYLTHSRCDESGTVHRAVADALKGGTRGVGWPSTAAEKWCANAAGNFAARTGTHCTQGEVFDEVVEFARGLLRDLDTQRRTLLETASTLYAPAVRECLERGLPDTAHRAVEHLADVLRGLWSVSEWNDWSEHRGPLSNAIFKAWAYAADEAGHDQLVATPAEAEVVVDDVHAKLARRLQGNTRAVLLYLASRGAVCADTARTRDCIAAGLTAAGVKVSENTPKNAVASLRAQGEAVGLNLVESGDSGSWLTPAGQRVAALVPKPATVGTHAAPILSVRGG
jgi:hypothetical protein